MSNSLQIKRKTTAGAPAPATLQTGELCYVLPDKKLYVKNDDNTVTQVNQIITSGTAAPAGGNDGDIYLQYTP
jgi:hypothetical protein